jgi:hydrogenase maturation factor HypE
VIDKEPKYGLAVMGVVHPDHIATKAGAKAGDVLILTKPLGMGIIATALKMETAKPDHVKAAVEVMKTLNRKAARLMRQVGVDAVTDITGFALLGHAQEMNVTISTMSHLPDGMRHLGERSSPLCMWESNLDRLRRLRTGVAHESSEESELRFGRRE